MQKGKHPPLGASVSCTSQCLCICSHRFSSHTISHTFSHIPGSCCCVSSWSDTGAVTNSTSASSKSSSATSGGNLRNLNGLNGISASSAPLKMAGTWTDKDAPPSGASLSSLYTCMSSQGLHVAGASLRLMRGSSAAITPARRVRKASRPGPFAPTGVSSKVSFSRSRKSELTTMCFDCNCNPYARTICGTHSPWSSVRNANPPPHQSGLAFDANFVMGPTCSSGMLLAI
mmetsp:Transcript_1607/g.4147  ORF Transcript_1607/g.4147 Transcript_1607/m.4147 type:complete len:230 (-) Transcript_1607:254-943(-)